MNSCSCDGSNSSCSKCFGTGIVQPKSNSINFPPRWEPKTPKAARKQEPTKFSATQLKYCGRCKCSFNVIFWKKHIIQQHSGIDYADFDLSKTEVACGKCLLQIPEAQFKAHLKLCQGKSEYEHVRILFRKKFRRGSQTSAAIDRKRKAELDNVPEKRFFETEQPNIDSTRRYAHSYRERGRFGSHPSHDGFGDEDKP